jgi:hypothetical protein
MENLLNFLTVINPINIILTAWATYTITTIAQKKEFEKGIQVSEKSKNEIIQEIRGQIASLKNKDN